jgi:hypothetical protein
LSVAGSRRARCQLRSSRLSARTPSTAGQAVCRAQPLPRRRLLPNRLPPPKGCGGSGSSPGASPRAGGDAPGLGLPEPTAAPTTGCGRSSDWFYCPARVGKRETGGADAAARKSGANRWCVATATPTSRRSAPAERGRGSALPGWGGAGQGQPHPGDPAKGVSRARPGARRSLYLFSGFYQARPAEVMRQ